jgi:hypothetical protein
MRNKAFDGFQIWGVRNNDVGLWHNDIGWGAMRVAKKMRYADCEAVVEAHPDVDTEISRLQYD